MCIWGRRLITVRFRPGGWVCRLRKFRGRPQDPGGRVPGEGAGRGHRLPRVGKALGAPKAYVFHCFAAREELSARPETLSPWPASGSPESSENVRFHCVGVRERVDCPARNIFSSARKQVPKPWVVRVRSPDLRKSTRPIIV